MKLNPARRTQTRPPASDAVGHPLAASALADVGGEPLAKLFVSDAGGALRTLLGAAHRHFIGVLPSLKTGLSNPFEGIGEQALACDSESDADVHYFQTQAFRLRMLVNGRQAEWICDHLRQLRCGRVEAIEVKGHPKQMDGAYRQKLIEARTLLADIGWRVVIRYEDGIVGCPARQVNRSDLMQDRSVHVDEDGIAAFERMRVENAHTTFGALCRELDSRRAFGEAKARSMMARGRARTDLDRLITDASPVELLPTPRFLSKISF
jgi:hypothetical protein